jgi:hypothetical protein
MKVTFEYIIEKATKLENGEIEIMATGMAPENIATAVNPEVEIVMQSIPPQMREMMNQQQKMFKDMQKPMIKFRITEQQYSQGDWKVGGIVEVTVTEQDAGAV